MKPCIENDIVPPNREVLEGGNAGILVPGGDDQRLCEEMSKLATDSGLAQKFSCAAISKVREFYSIDSVADKYIRLYGQL